MNPFEVKDILSLERCKALIDFSELKGYAIAPVTTPEGPVMRLDYRLNERVIHFDFDLAKELFQLLEPYLPVIDGKQPYAINEMFRFYKYKPGQFFKKHKDGVHKDKNGGESKLTLLIYLNEDYEGGATAFRDKERIWKEVTSEIGKAFLFDHHTLHEGKELVSGVKYVLRSDVMYR